MLINHAGLPDIKPCHGKVILMNMDDRYLPFSSYTRAASTRLPAFRQLITSFPVPQQDWIISGAQAMFFDDKNAVNAGPSGIAVEF